MEQIHSSENQSENILYPEIAKELSLLRERDQFIRTESALDDSVDKENTLKLKAIIEKIGWPGISKVGRLGASSAWLLAQHADLDVEFQEKCLKLMEENKNDVDNRNIAYLTDRVRVNKGMNQLYGTQFRGSGSDYGPHEIEDPDNLEERRRSAGLETFEEYEMKMKESNKKLEERKRGDNSPGVK